MYTIERKNEIKYIYIDLIENDKILDLEKFELFISKFQKTDPVFIFDYNCLEYPYIKDIINLLNINFKNFIIKCDKCKHIDIIEKYKDCNFIIPELHVKIDTSLSYEKVMYKLNDNVQLFNYYKDLDKTFISKSVVDLYVNKSNISYLRETVKILSDEGFLSKIIFDECTLNGYYKTNFREDKIVDNNSILTSLMFEDILKYKSLMIDNRYDINIMLNNLMNLKCWNKHNFIQICISPNFKLKICNKIDYELDLDLFDCLDDNEYLKNDICKKLLEERKKYCLGCNCEDFINEIKQ